MLKDIQLSLGEVAEIAGIPLTTLDRWVSNGLVTPAHSGGGPGNHRRFNLVQAVAVVCGAAHRAVGLQGQWVEAVVRAVADLSLKQLDRALDAGETLVVPLVGDEPPYGLLLPPTKKDEVTEQLTLDACLRRVLDGAAELAKRPANRTGRNRALAVVRRMEID